MRKTQLGPGLAESGLGELLGGERHPTSWSQDRSGVKKTQLGPGVYSVRIGENCET